jgi:hypothetical protein
MPGVKLKTELTPTTTIPTGFPTEQSMPSQMMFKPNRQTMFGHEEVDGWSVVLCVVS